MSEQPRMNRDLLIDDLSILSSFLVWAEADGAMYGSHRATAALEAFTRVMYMTGVTDYTPHEQATRLRLALGDNNGT